jgi:radical SAM superfamily enzyme YgiQ (UPF0313 family)
MRVLFLNPPFHRRFSRESRSPAVTKSGTLYYPKWLSYAAGVAFRNGHDVELMDAPADDATIGTVIDLLENKRIEALICDSSTPSINNDLRVVSEIRKRFTVLPFILVGRHVSAMPDETFRMCEHLEYVAVREYEYTVRDWLLALESGASMERVDGLVWRSPKGDIVHNKVRQPIENLDELPFVTEVYKRFLDIENYFYGHSRHPLVVFDTSRGCPYRCSFCAYPQTFSGHKLRFRSVENVADEFEFVAREFPQVKSIMLEDDTFIVNKTRTRKLAEELIRRGNQIPFDSNCRADVGVDVEFLKTLKKAGARLFCVGFESGDDAVLEGMDKRLNLQTAERFMQCCRAAGIMVHGCFMLGNLNETRDTLKRTLDFALKIRPDTAQFYPIMVYPGTRAYKEAKQKGYLETEDFSQWLTEEGLHNSVVNLPNLSHKELVEFCDYARRKFYLNPSYLSYKAIQSLKNPAEMKRNLKGFRTLSHYLFRGSFQASKQAS